MTPDSIGTKDYMAVVISKDSLNWFDVNKKLGQNPQLDYSSRLNSVFASQLIRNVHFQTTTKGNMQFKTREDNNSIVACIVEIDK